MKLATRFLLALCFAFHFQALATDRPAPAAPGKALVTCQKDSKVYNVGEKVPADDCNTCSCLADGKIACTRMACVPNYCLYKGKKLAVGDTYQVRCNTCTCQVGGIITCTEKLCSTPNGSVPSSATEECKPNQADLIGMYKKYCESCKMGQVEYCQTPTHRDSCESFESARRLCK